MATLYKITDWDEHFEKNGPDSGRAVKSFKWIAVPTKTDGLGFGVLRQQKNNADLLAAWILLLEISAKQPKGKRGLLQRDGQPLTPETCELMTGFDARIFKAAFEFFSKKPLPGWLTVVPGESTGIPVNPGESTTTVQDSTEQNNTPPDSEAAEAKDGLDARFDQIWEAYPKKAGKKQARPEIMAAIESKGFEALLASVQAYAAAVANWPEADRCFVPDPVRWFKRGNYDDDPATWARKGNGSAKNLPLIR